MTKTKNQPVDFESHLKELTVLVEEMEKGDLKLNEALEKFERGIALSKLCQHSLQQAEQTVKILTQDSKSIQDYSEDSHDTLE